jgi:hypothetical protein
MTKKQDSRIAMYRTLRNILQTNIEAVSGIPALAALVPVFSDMIDKIEQTGREQATVYKTRTSVKQSEQSRLRANLYPVLSALHALGHELGDIGMQDSTDLTERDLKRARDQELVRIADITLGYVGTHSATLPDYGITEARMAALQSSRDLYYAALHDRDAGLASRKASQPNLQAAFNETDLLISKRLDRLMVVLKEEHPTLYEEYGKARTVRHPGVRHRVQSETNPAPADIAVAPEQSQPATVTLNVPSPTVPAVSSSNGEQNSESVVTNDGSSSGSPPVIFLDE